MTTHRRSCPFCGYDISATTTPTCPECGRDTAQPATINVIRHIAAISIATIAALTIAAIACIRFALAALGGFSRTHVWIDVAALTLLLSLPGAYALRLLSGPPLETSARRSAVTALTLVAITAAATACWLLIW